MQRGPPASPNRGGTRCTRPTPEVLSRKRDERTTDRWTPESHASVTSRDATSSTRARRAGGDRLVIVAGAGCASEPGWVGRRQPAGTETTDVRGEGEAGHLPAPDRLAAAPRPVRLQAGAGQARRQALPRRVPQGQAVRVHVGRAQAPGDAAQVRPVRQERRLDVGRDAELARRWPTNSA